MPAVDARTWPQGRYALTRDLGRRWTEARLAALRAAAPAAAGDLSDADLLAAALTSNGELALRKAFDHSLALGRGFRRFVGVALKLDDLPAILSQLDAPCARGLFLFDGPEAGVRLLRGGCPCADVHPRACDFWQEALQGLILGLLPGFCHSRHASRGHGDTGCVDAIHSPHSKLAYGAIPEEMSAGLSAVVRAARTLDGGTEVIFLGLSQQTIYYRITSRAHSQVSVKTYVERSLRRHFPRLDSREVLARGVISTST